MKRKYKADWTTPMRIQGQKKANYDAHEGKADAMKRTANLAKLLGG